MRCQCRNRSVLLRHFSLKKICIATVLSLAGMVFSIMGRYRSLLLRHFSVNELCIGMAMIICLVGTAWAVPVLKEVLPCILGCLLGVEQFFWRRSGIWIFDTFGRGISYAIQSWMAYTAVPAACGCVGVGADRFQRAWRGLFGKTRVIERIKATFDREGSRFMKHAGELWAFWPLRNGTDYTVDPAGVYYADVDDATGFQTWFVEVCSARRGHTLVPDRHATPPASRHTSPLEVYTEDTPIDQARCILADDLP